MDAGPLIERLSRFPLLLAAAVEATPAADLRWKPDAATWSILEVCCHLLDEETEDFRARLEATLMSPETAWPPLDLAHIAERRGYNLRDAASTMGEFAAARRASVAWLQSRPLPDWSATHHHPKIGALRAGDLLAAWAAHDALHLRQIAGRLLDLVRRDAGAFRTDYAGA